MIRVDRSAEGPPRHFKESGDKECEAAIGFYSQPENAKAQYGKFTAYKTKGMADALNRLFHGKCAYCESQMAAVQPSDIEHYRPKGAILIGGVLDRPGYYWLAAAWENLIPSCIYCNRPNQIELPDGTRRTLGKANQFPLELERSRVRSHRRARALARERPLVLDPCGDEDPRKHLEFLATGEVRARTVRGKPSRRGATSIEVLALLRRPLVQARRDQAAKIRGQVELILDALRSYRSRPADPKVRRRLRLQLQALQRLRGPREPYLAMSADVIEADQPGFLDLIDSMTEWLADS